MSGPSAAILVIGNEILSGKVEDTNAAFLARELRALGVNLERIVVIPDEVEIIADEVRNLSPRYDFVFTSGGVGPTHDDVTIEGVARGLGRGVVISPELERCLAEHGGLPLNEARRKMAEVPEGAELVTAESAAFPTIKVANLYVLPGVPELFRAKFLALRSRFASEPFRLRVIYLVATETVLAEYLNDTVARFPEILLGSYPKLSHPEYKVRVTLESKRAEYLEEAFGDLLARIPGEFVVRTE